MKHNQILQEVSKRTGLPYDVCKEAIMLKWKCYEDDMEEDKLKIKIANLGILHLKYRHRMRLDEINKDKQQSS